MPGKQGEQREFARNLRHANAARSCGVKLKDRNVLVPALEWVDGQFVPKAPGKQPHAHVRATVMDESMRWFRSSIPKK